MDSFPSTLRPEYTENFGKDLYNNWERQFREEMYLYILKRDSRDYFDFDSFNKRTVNDKILMGEMAGKILGELKELGWDWTICYGGTGVYVHAPGEKPAHAW